MTPAHAPMHDNAQTDDLLPKSMLRFLRPSRAPMWRPTAGPPPPRQIARFGIDLTCSIGAVFAMSSSAAMAALAALGSFAAAALRASIAAATKLDTVSESVVPPLLTAPAFSLSLELM